MHPAPGPSSCCRVLSASNSSAATPSIGVSYYPEDATEAQQLLKCADDAMYAAKDAGRNAVRFFQAGSQRVS